MKEKQYPTIEEIKRPVTRYEINLLFMRSLYSALKDGMPDDVMQEIIAPSGITTEMVHAALDNL